MKNFPYLALFLMTLPAFVFAAEKWQLLSGKNTLAVIGTCSEKEVRFDLYRSGDAEPIYTSGVLCRDGAFEFSDDLLQWESLGDGSYELVVDKERKNPRQVVIERPLESAPVPATARESTVIDAGTDMAAPRFLDAFVMLQRSLVDMRIRLAESDYPDAIKLGLDAAIDGIETVAGTMADLLFVSETGKAETSGSGETSEAVPEDAKTETTQETGDVQSQASAVNEAERAVTVDTAGLLSTDGLSVAGGSLSGIAIENGD
jgi:hypothetical protein